MTLFRNSTHRELWRQAWCETCFQPDEAQRRIQGKEVECPIWAKAMRTGKKPIEWDRNTRTDEMQRSIKCNAYLDRPPRNIRVYNQDYETIALFDLDAMPEGVSFVPVENWPEKPKADGVDHA